MVRKLEKLVDNYKPKIYPLSYIEDICLQVTIPWGFHQCQQTVERGEQTLGLVQTPVLLRLWDAVHLVLKLLEGFKPLRSFVTPSAET